MREPLYHLALAGGFLGLKWSVWQIIGWLGNAIFATRFAVQWYATEKRRQVVVPTLFWWLSLAGSLMLLTYAIFYLRNAVIICAYAVAWIPYLRNLVIHHRHQNALRPCPECGLTAPAAQNYCGQCGARLENSPSPAPTAR